MSDYTANGHRPSRQRVPTWEYRFYFGIIFLATLPYTFVTCILGLCRPTDEDAAGKTFIARAWHHASIITPQIFSQ